MKRLYFMMLVLAMLLPALAGCQNSAPVPTATGKSSPNVTKTTSITIQPVTSMITLEEAIAIALKDADLTREQVRNLDAELDRDSGVVHYDVDFEKDKKDYDYEIHAETGKILKSNQERD